MERLRLSQDATGVLERLHRASGIRRNMWARAALGLSLGLASDEFEFGDLDSSGMELTRQMLFGDDEPVLLALVRQRHGHLGPDANTAPLIRQHVERGIRLLDEHYQKLNRRGDELMIELARRCADDLPVQTAFDFDPPPIGTDSFGVTLTLGVGAADDKEISTVLNRPGSAPHVAIMGRNGTGKTRTALTYLERINKAARYSIPFLIFDYAKGDIAANADFVQATDATVVTLPSERLPIAPLALIAPDEHAIGIAAHRFRDTLMAVVRNLGPKQKSRCLDLIREAYDEVGPDQLGLDDIAAIAVRTYENNGWPEDSLLAVLKELTDFPLFQPANSSGRHPFYNRSHVVDVHGLPEDLRKLAVFLTLDRLYSEIMAADDAPIDSDGNRLLRLIIAIDEAHHYLACKQPTLEKMVREVRSKGVAIWLLSQSPDDFDQPRYNFAREMGLAIVFACVLERPKMLEAILGTKIQPQQLSQLPAGVALTRASAGSNPVRVRAWRA